MRLDVECHSMGPVSAPSCENLWAILGPAPRRAFKCAREELSRFKKPNAISGVAVWRLPAASSGRGDFQNRRFDLQISANLAEEANVPRPVPIPRAVA